MCVCARALSSYDHAACSREERADAKLIDSVARGHNLESPLPVMKAMVVSPLGGRVPPDHRGVLHNGLGIGGTRRDLEAEEVAAYLTKLRSLVPDMPRKRKLSKLEVIQRVIEYICDLQTALEETNAAHQDATTTSQSSRQPLLNATTTTATTTASTIATSIVTTSTTSATATVAER
ncbi:DNA-binding protein inhibitor ID-2 [Formica exsecta]|uniref:DNA-binding protein inhibitor ID-2 n=1 Tax=Formica exsecta TaxID=72781 RepID=UPI001143B20E|nr:DNA-binding protein inhibitor ID-2 [Formica exsecta]